MPPAAEWPLNLLYLGYLNDRNTAELLRVSRRLVTVKPSDLKSKNNFAVYSLLLGEDLQEALFIAQDLVKEKPDDPVFRSDLRLRPPGQRMPEESLEAMEKLPPEKRDDPGYALYFAMIHQAKW
jgi:hypothetical protein